MKKLLSVVLSLVMLFTLFGTVLVFADNPTTYNILDVKSQIRTIGRTEEVSNGIACDWTASGIEFNAVCSGDIAIGMTSTCADQGNKGSYNKDCYFTVYIDGVRQGYRVRTMDGTYTVTVAENLSQGTHKIKVLKENEKTNATVTMKSITFDGTFGSKPASQPYTFEFIGDSITSGHSALSTGSDTQASRDSCGTRTYAFLTAENFDAEARVTSISGGTITSLYTAYNKMTRTSDPYDFSLSKPDGVSIALGTNDGVRTVDYWQTNIKNFADAIRGGYNDDSIPIIMVVNLMDNGDALRANMAGAISNLYASDSSKYDKIYICSANGFTGGHPRQDKHLKASQMLTREFVEDGFVPYSALKADATATLTAANAQNESINGMNSVVAVGSSYSDAISGTLVDPLDPADVGNDSAHAVKYTADGTQASTINNNNTQVKFGTAYNGNYKSKGISFYINYKDNTDYGDEPSPTYTKPKIVVSYADKYVAIPITVAQGVTQKVSFDWLTCKSGLNYLFKQTFQNAGNVNISLELTGACECTIDNVKNELNAYTVTSNSNRSYTYSSANDYEIKGVTENYSPTTSTTTTTEPSSEPTETSSEPTEPSSSATVEKTVIYTMDEGKRMRSAGASYVNPESTYGSVKYMQVDDNYVLRLKCRLDQTSYFQLPADWYTAGGEGFTPVSISFDVAKGADLSSYYCLDSYFCTALGTGSAASGNKYQFNTKYTNNQIWFNSTFSTITIDLSEVTTGTVSDYSYFTFKSKKDTGAADTAGVYIDNVTITYEGSAPASPVSTSEGASIRLNNVTGIRFYTTINQEAIDALNTNNDEVKFGTLIGPADRIGDELTIEDVTSSNAVDVKFTSSTLYAENTIVGSLANIKQKNITRQFVGRGYVQIGDTYYYSETVASRSLAQVASSFKNDQNSGYSALDADVKALVDAWAAAA